MGDPRTATFTIPAGQTDSNILLLEDLARRHTFNGTLFAPAEMPETVTVLVSPTASNPAWTIQLSGNVNVALSAGKAVPVLGVTAAAMMLRASGAVAADRVVQWYAVAVA